MSAFYEGRLPLQNSAGALHLKAVLQPGGSGEGWGTSGPRSWEESGLEGGKMVPEPPDNNSWSS